MKKTKPKPNGFIHSPQRSPRKRPTPENPAINQREHPNSHYGVQNDFRYDIPDAHHTDNGEIDYRQKKTRLRNGPEVVNNYDVSDVSDNVTHPTAQRGSERLNPEVVDVKKTNFAQKNDLNKTGKSDKKNVFAFGSTVQPPEKNVKKPPLVEKQTSQNHQDPPTPREHFETHAINNKKTKPKVQEDRVISDESDNNPSWKTNKAKNSEQKSQNEIAKGKKSILKTEKPDKTAGENANTKQSDNSGKPKKGILRKTSSFKVIGNSSNYFGYMSITEEMAADKKVAKRVRYHDHDGVQRTGRPISA